MDKTFNSILSITIVPQAVALISEKEGINEIDAMETFYQSKVYALLSDEETKVWHYSPLTIYGMWKTENATGKVIFPEE